MTQETIDAKKPTTFSSPFADTGDKNTIAASGTDVANMATGFPSIFSTPRPSGKSVARKDMNGILNAVSSLNYYFQYMGRNPWVSGTSYPKGAKAWYSNAEYVSTADNNTTIPGETGASWIKLNDLSGTSGGSTVTCGWDADKISSILNSLYSISGNISSLSSSISNIGTKIDSLAGSDGPLLGEYVTTSYRGNRSFETLDTSRLFIAPYRSAYEDLNNVLSGFGTLSQKIYAQPSDGNWFLSTDDTVRYTKGTQITCLGFSNGNEINYNGFTGTVGSTETVVPSLVFNSQLLNYKIADAGSWETAETSPQCFYREHDESGVITTTYRDYYIYNGFSTKHDVLSSFFPDLESDALYQCLVSFKLSTLNPHVAIASVIYSESSSTNLPEGWNCHYRNFLNTSTESATYKVYFVGTKNVAFLCGFHNIMNGTNATISNVTLKCRKLN